MVTLYPEFYNDTFGPIMQPGSSSHMAAPCRMGYLCNSLLGEELSDIRVELDTEGSFSGTFGLMNEDLGMLNGAFGCLPDEKNFFDIKEILKAKGISYTFDFCEMKESSHINAVKFILTGKSGRKASLVANSTGGGMVECVWVNGYAFDGKGDTWVLFVYDPGSELDHGEVSKTVASFAEWVAEYIFRNQMELWGEQLEQELTGALDALSDRGAASSLLSLLPNEFTTGDLIKLRARKNQSVKTAAISMVLNRWKNNRRIEPCGNKTWRKL